MQNSLLKGFFPKGKFRPFLASPFAAAILCVPPSHIPTNLTGPQAPQVICEFKGPSDLQGWLTGPIDHTSIYYTAGPHAKVMFKGPLYGENGLPYTPHLVPKR